MRHARHALADTADVYRRSIHKTSNQRTRAELAQIVRHLERAGRARTVEELQEIRRTVGAPWGEWTGAAEVAAGWITYALECEKHGGPGCHQSCPGWRETR